MNQSPEDMTCDKGLALTPHPPPYPCDKISGPKFAKYYAR